MSNYSSIKLSGGSISMSDTAPANALAGALWYDTTDGTLYIRSGTIWAEVAAASGPTGAVGAVGAAGATGATGAFGNNYTIGNTATRPASPTSGYTRINSETNNVEVYYNSAWYNLQYIGTITATGGTVSYSGNYKIHTFNSTSTFTVTDAPSNSTIDVLVVAGGGAGGILTITRGAGGGAGGLIYIPAFTANTGNIYSVTVGAGGPSSGGTVVANGANSVFSGAGRTLTAIGGGSGGYNDSTNNGAVGGSGGGQWYPTYTGAASNQPVNTSDGISTYATTGWGNKGGDSSTSQPYGSGGGGAGGAGGNFNGANGPVGGLGKSYDISGTTRAYAGGGSSAGHPSGGGTVVFDNTNYGGLGGGGTGYNNAYNALANGANNTGGGGGSGGSGGSGIVIIRYRYQ